MRHTSRVLASAASKRSPITRAPPAHPPLRSSAHQTPARILPNRGNPKLGQHSHNPNDRLTHRRGRINIKKRLSQRDESNPATAELMDRLDLDRNMMTLSTHGPQRFRLRENGGNQRPLLAMLAPLAYVAMLANR